jgi:hypothetical protein
MLDVRNVGAALRLLWKIDFRMRTTMATFSKSQEHKISKLCGEGVMKACATLKQASL